ncbi:MAG: PEP-CTERM sorting domain-containing protein, partial [Casimicrobiaceae bacterium]
MTTYFRWLASVAFACATIASNAFAAQINVLWYTYADIGSEYRTFYKTLVDTGQPHAIGNVWNLTFWGPNDPTPDFSKYNLLVIHSGESFRTGAPGKPNATPNYSG